jgi:hypothetical protein
VFSTACVLLLCRSTTVTALPATQMRMHALVHLQMHAHHVKALEATYHVLLRSHNTFNRGRRSA